MHDRSPEGEFRRGRAVGELNAVLHYAVVACHHLYGDDAAE